MIDLTKMSKKNCPTSSQMRPSSSRNFLYANPTVIGVSTERKVIVSSSVVSEAVSEAAFSTSVTMYTDLDAASSAKRTKQRSAWRLVVTHKFDDLDSVLPAILVLRMMSPCTKFNGRTSFVKPCRVKWAILSPISTSVSHYSNKKCQSFVAINIDAVQSVVGSGHPVMRSIPYCREARAFPRRAARSFPTDAARWSDPVK